MKRRRKRYNLRRLRREYYKKHPTYRGYELGTYRSKFK